MKILFYPLINLDGIGYPLQYCDYLVDCCYHGFKSLLGNDLEESMQLPHWYNDYPNKIELYGNGFSVYCLLDRPILADCILEKIVSKYYDQIIVPIHNNRHKNPDNIKLVSVLSKYCDSVKVIDGNDDQSVQFEITEFAKYFKRELLFDKPNLFPITFGIPKEKVVDHIPEKLKDISHVLPKEGGRVNWTYFNEDEYYQEYRSSWFAYTKKKGGWDCMRHYEIVANGCIPLFENIENCPPKTMHNWPKDLLREINENQYMINKTDVIRELLSITNERFTTEKLAKYILES